MQQLFICVKRKRKVPDVSDVHLLGVVPVRDAQIRKKLVNVIRTEIFTPELSFLSFKSTRNIII